ncbi:MAG TPA: hypothetical protein VLF60_05085 [Candidatus Saccharimonadales bacterium]|nr:hypothetical protein [Candidatus Saccharimonadales bacterium]
MKLATRIVLSIVIGMFLTLASYALVITKITVHHTSANEMCQNAGGQICPEDASYDAIVAKRGWPLVTRQADTTQETGTTGTSISNSICDIAIYSGIVFTVVQLINMFRTYKLKKSSK